MKWRFSNSGRSMYRCATTCFRQYSRRMRTAVSGRSFAKCSSMPTPWEPPSFLTIQLLPAPRSVATNRSNRAQSSSRER